MVRINRLFLCLRIIVSLNLLPVVLRMKKGEGHQLVFDDKENEEKTILTSSGDYHLTVKKDMISNINNSMSLTVAKGRNSEIKKGMISLFLKKATCIMMCMEILI